MVYDDSPLSLNIAASATTDYNVHGVLIPVTMTDFVRLQHADVSFQNPVRNLQVLGAISLGLGFYARDTSQIDFLTISVWVPTTPDATVIAIDRMAIAVEDVDYLPVNGALFGGALLPAFVSATCTFTLKNPTAGAVGFGLSIVSAIETGTP
jgi:hypothetical protein